MGNRNECLWFFRSRSSGLLRTSAQSHKPNDPVTFEDYDTIPQEAYSAAMQCLSIQVFNIACIRTTKAMHFLVLNSANLVKLWELFKLRICKKYYWCNMNITQTMMKSEIIRKNSLICLSITPLIFISLLISNYIISTNLSKE